jgi:hypothetical protein
VDNLN